MNSQLLPLISEKSMQQGGKGKFTFRVVGSMDKTEIKKAIEKDFKVTVVTVSTSWIKGRVKRVGARRDEKVMGSWKKAVVTLKPGQKIDIFDTV